MSVAAVLNWRMPARAVEPTPTTRAQAIARGLPRYFTGQPCKAGHVAGCNRRHKFHPQGALDRF